MNFLDLAGLSIMEISDIHEAELGEKIFTGYTSA